MYAFIKGPLFYKDPTLAIVDAAGVGYELRISLQTYSALPDLGQPTQLFSLLVVREDSHTLFGFSEISEKKLFEDLTSVSGIGPSIALVMLSSLNANEIKRAIVTEDLKTIQGIKGIGAKTAQRAIIELKDKFKKESLGIDIPTGGPMAGGSGDQRQAIDALIALGIPKTIAEKSIETIIKREGNALSVEQMIKLALR
jgi:holliday junction DNA helicase RuvA